MRMDRTVWHGLGVSDDSFSFSSFLLHRCPLVGYNGAVHAQRQFFESQHIQARTMAHHISTQPPLPVANYLSISISTCISTYLHYLSHRLRHDYNCTEPAALGLEGNTRCPFMFLSLWRLGRFLLSCGKDERNPGSPFIHSK